MMFGSSETGRVFHPQRSRGRGRGATQPTRARRAERTDFGRERGLRRSDSNRTSDYDSDGCGGRIVPRDYRFDDSNGRGRGRGDDRPVQDWSSWEPRGARGRGVARGRPRGRGIDIARSRRVGAPSETLDNAQLGFGSRRALRTVVKRNSAGGRTQVDSTLMVPPRDRRYLLTLLTAAMEEAPDGYDALQTIRSAATGLL